MSKETSGYLVETKDGKTGRTFDNKEFVNGKVQVFLETETENTFLPSAILCDPKTLKIKGFIN